MYSDIELLDADGYPTEEALDFIENPDDSYCPHELMEMVREMWYFREWGWREDKVQDLGQPYIRYDISTAGWSGNESIISALKNNKKYFWSMYWEESRRGGHYKFILPYIDNNMNKEVKDKDIGETEFAK